jgi:hypothetical protein
MSYQAIRKEASDMEEEKSFEKSTMRFRSTGLGKTMLYGDVEDVYYKDGAVIVSVKTTSPVLWHIRVASSRKGLWKIVGIALKFNVVLHLLGLKKDGWPADF